MITEIVAPCSAPTRFELSTTLAGMIGMRVLLRAAAHPIDDGVERDPIAKQQIAVAIDVDRVRQLGVERLERLLGVAGAAQYREDLCLATQVPLAAHST